jgi:hypothetical protein
MLQSMHLSMHQCQIQLSDMLDGDGIESLDLGLSKSQATLDGGEEEEENVLSFGRNALDDSDEEELDSDEEEMDETDPARLAELQARYGFGALRGGDNGDNGGDNGGGNGGGNGGDDDWGFASGGNEDQESDVNFGDAGNNGNDGNDGNDGNNDDEGWGDFGGKEQGAKKEEEEDVPPAPATTTTFAPPQEGEE